MPGFLGVAMLLIALPGPAQDQGLKPSERAEKGFALLGEKSLKLVADVADDHGGSKQESLSSYVDLILLVNKKRAVTFRLLGPQDEDRQVCSLKPSELPSKVLGAWLWYKICFLADLAEPCRAAGIIN